MRRFTSSCPLLPGLMVAAALAGLFPLSAVHLEGQDVGPVGPGDRVRLSAPAASGEFLVSELRRDELLVRSDSLSEITRVPTRSVFEIERHEGRRSGFVAALEGAGVGALGGAMVSTHCALPHVSCGVTSVQQALIGAGIGAMVSLLTRGGEQLWREIRLPGQPSRMAAGDGRGGLRARDERAGSADFVATADLRALVDQGEDLYRLLQRIRPIWLRTRFVGGRREAPDVYVDGARIGGLAALREYRVRDVRSIEFVDPNDASSPFNSVMGVISIRTGA